VPNVHGIEFSASQCDLVKSLIRELLKDGNCAVYPVPHMKPDGELRMACTPPTPSARRQKGVFVRILPGVKTASVLRPTHAMAGAEKTSVTKYTHEELLETIRIWRKEVTEFVPQPTLHFELPKAA
jgi:hypothetical protein